MHVFPVRTPICHIVPISRIYTPPPSPHSGPKAFLYKIWPRIREWPNLIIPKSGRFTFTCRPRTGLCINPMWAYDLFWICLLSPRNKGQILTKRGGGVCKNKADGGRHVNVNRPLSWDDEVRPLLKVGIFTANFVYFLPSLRAQTAKTLICTKSGVSADSRKSAKECQKVRKTRTFCALLRKECAKSAVFNTFWHSFWNRQISVFAVWALRLDRKYTLTPVQFLFRESSRVANPLACYRSLWPSGPKCPESQDTLGICQNPLQGIIMLRALRKTTRSAHPDNPYPLSSPP